MWTYLLVPLTLTDIPTFERFWWEGLWTHLHSNYLRSSCRAPFLDPLACKTPIWCVYTYVLRTYRLLVTLVYHLARAPGTAAPATAHGMLIASDHVRATPRPIPGKLYPSLVSIYLYGLNVSLVHRRFPLPLRMRVIDDDLAYLYVPWSLLT